MRVRVDLQRMRALFIAEVVWISVGVCCGMTVLLAVS